MLEAGVLPEIEKAKTMETKEAVMEAEATVSAEGIMDIDRPEGNDPANTESFRMFMNVVEEEPDHSGALFELAAVQQNRGKYHDAIALLRRAVEGKETVPEDLKDQMLGAPSISDAKAMLGVALSLESYGPDELFADHHIRNSTGAFDRDKPIETNKEQWYEAQALFKELQAGANAKVYLPPIVCHVLGPAPDEDKSL